MILFQQNDFFRQIICVLAKYYFNKPILFLFLSLNVFNRLLKVNIKKGLSTLRKETCFVQSKEMRQSLNLSNGQKQSKAFFATGALKGKFMYLSMPDTKKGFACQNRNSKTWKATSKIV